MRRIRREQNLTTAELSRRLSALGYPIADTGITKAEKGDRRVDVDDLVPLALALGITPNALLMPDADWLGARTVYELTPAVSATADELWQWAQGETPLPAPVPALPSPANGNQALEFTIRSRPYLLTPRPPGTPGGPERELTELSIAVTRAVKAGAKGAEIRRVAEMTLAQPPSARISEDEMATWLEDRPRPQRRER